MNIPRIEVTVELKSVSGKQNGGQGKYAVRGEYYSSTQSGSAGKVGETYGNVQTFWEIRVYILNWISGQEIRENAIPRPINLNVDERTRLSKRHLDILTKIVGRHNYRAEEKRRLAKI
ncbi:MAG: hypothetical protein AABX11_04165 [Nanoarchaeota archaeon]